MALTDEQRSMLQLLLSGQTYDDIASLLGIGRDEVRSRARAALQAIAGADPDAQVAVSDYLLGQADPIGRADAVRHLQSDPAANALAASLVAQLRLLAPQAELPEIPAPRGGRAAPPPAPPAVPTPPTAAPGQPPPGQPPPVATPGPPTPPGAPQPGARRSLPSRLADAIRGIGASRRRAQLATGIGALGLLVLVGVLAVAGVFGGGDDADDENGSPSDELTVVELAPLQPGSAASGQAVFAQTGDQPLLQVNLTGLQQPGEGQIYVVWLYNSDQVTFPLARDRANEQGNLTGAAAIPQQLVPLLPQFGCVDVSLASTRQTQNALQQAAQGETLPRHVGRTVLRGQVPAEPGGTAPSGAESSCEGTVPEEAAGIEGAGDDTAEGATDPGSGEGALGQ